MNEVTITINEDDAILSFDILSRIADDPSSASTLNETEISCIYDLVSLMESKITAPFEDNYKEIVEGIIARKSEAA